MASKFNKVILPLSKLIEKNKKEALFVVGGHCPSAIPEYILRTTKADIAIIGEGENTLLEIVNNKENCFDVEGIAYLKDNEKIIKNLPRKLNLNLSCLPFPAWDLFPIERYATCIKFFEHKSNDRYMAITTSRGCINQCSFCQRLEKGYRIRTIENIIEEIEILNKDYGINYFEIMDEMFIISKNRLKEFKNKLKERNLKIKYTCDGRVDYIDKEILDMLEESGCKFLNFGFESTDQKVLDLMKKRTTIEQNIKAAELTKQQGIALGLNFLWGCPGDTIKTLRENAVFIKKYNTYDQLRTIRPVTPFPGCELYSEAVKLGLLKNEQDFFDKFKNSDLLTVNFTELSEKEFYENLYQVNKELIKDHYVHTTNNIEEADEIINRFYRLYFEGDISFRGARTYQREMN